jgi:hypothetical protein
VKATERTWPDPVGRTVPEGGVYVKVPGTEAVASSWAGPSGVPEVRSAGLGQVIDGVAFKTLIIAVVVTVR